MYCILSQIMTQKKIIPVKPTLNMTICRLYLYVCSQLSLSVYKPIFGQKRNICSQLQGLINVNKNSVYLCLRSLIRWF